MSNLSAFLKQNAEVQETVKLVASKRFKENGKPVEWEICSITSEEDESIRKSCMRRVPVPGKKNLSQPELDYNNYIAKLATRCTVYPNLNDAALQDSYGAKGAEKLLKTMLLAGEFYDYVAEVQRINGFDVGMDEKVEEAKN